MIEQKKLVIELLRFWFTLVVCLHHFRMYSNALPYGGGYIAVDFFFILSGYFLAWHVERQGEDVKRWNSLVKYVGKRYMRLFPTYFLAFIVAFLTRKAWLKEVFSGTVGGYIREAFLIEIFCNGSSERMNPADWYCGYLLVGSVLVYMLLIYGGKICKMPMYLAIALMGYSILLFTYGHINVFPKEAGLFSLAIVRVISGLCAGVFIYKINVARDTKIDNKRWCWTCMAICSFLFIAYMMLWDNAYNVTDYLVIFMSALLILWAVKSPWKSQKIWVNKSIVFLGTISYTLFLNHFLIVRVFTVKQYLYNWDWKIVSIVYLLSVLVFSMIMFWMEKWIRKNIFSY